MQIVDYINTNYRLYWNQTNLCRDDRSENLPTRSEANRVIRNRLFDFLLYTMNLIQITWSYRSYSVLLSICRVAMPDKSMLNYDPPNYWLQFQFSFFIPYHDLITWINLCLNMSVISCLQFWLLHDVLLQRQTTNHRHRTGTCIVLWNTMKYLYQ